VKNVLLVAAIFATVLLSGCKDSLDSDGVPIIADVNLITVDGVKLTANGFHTRYCSGLRDNATCKAVFVVWQDKISGRSRADATKK